MKNLILPAFCILLSTAQVNAQSADAGSTDGSDSETDGGSLMEKGLGLFLDGLKDEMSPAMKQLQEMADEYGPALQSFLEEMGPALAGILAKIDNWQGYHPPEILPNGDIILRKRTGDDPGEKSKDDDTGSSGSTDT